jgi:hypothetical protein
LKASGGPKFLPPAINQPRDNIHPPSDSKNRCARREGLCDDRVTALRLDRQEHQRSLQASVADLKPKLLALDPLVHLHAIDENIAELAALPSHRCCARPPRPQGPPMSAAVKRCAALPNFTHRVAPILSASQQPKMRLRIEGRAAHGPTACCSHSKPILQCPLWRRSTRRLPLHLPNLLVCRAARASTRLRSIKFARDKPSVPPEDGVRQGRSVAERPAVQSLADFAKRRSLAV